MSKRPYALRQSTRKIDLELIRKPIGPVTSEL